MKNALKLIQSGIAGFFNRNMSKMSSKESSAEKKILSSEKCTTPKKITVGVTPQKMTMVSNTSIPEDIIDGDEDDDELLVVETCSTSSSSYSSPTCSLSSTPIVPHSNNQSSFHLSSMPKTGTTSTNTKTASLQHKEGIQTLMHQLNSRRHNRRAARTTSIRSSAGPFPVRLYNKLIKVRCTKI